MDADLRGAICYRRLIQSPKNEVECPIERCAVSPAFNVRHRQSSHPWSQTASGIGGAIAEKLR
jgi:hypothetical protein